MPGPYEDPRAHEVRARYRAIFGGDEFPVAVEAIAADLFGLFVEQSEASTSRACSSQPSAASS